MIKVGAIWMKEKDGKTYGSGSISVDAPLTIAEGLNILLFKPREARQNGPDWEVFVSKPKPRDDAPKGRADDEFPA